MSNTTQALSRIEAILDDSSFVEIGAGVTARSTDFNIQEKKAPSDGVITGYGVINGNLVYVYSQDATVLNGSIGEMHAKKISALYDYAMKMGAPVIGLIDCAGLRLQEATDALEGFGTIYKKMSIASGVIPQITAVYGNCGGGLAILSSLSDFTFMEDSKAKLFVNSPNALDGNNESKLDSASAKFQAEAGVVDFTGDEETIANGVRQLVSMLPANNEEDAAVSATTDDLNRACPDMAAEIADPALALSDIADDNVFVEVKASYAKEMVTGFIQVDGITIGAVANRTALYDEEGEVAENRFLQLRALTRQRILLISVMHLKFLYLHLLMLRDSKLQWQLRRELQLQVPSLHMHLLTQMYLRLMLLQVRLMEAHMFL